MVLLLSATPPLSQIREQERRNTFLLMHPVPLQTKCNSYRPMPMQCPSNNISSLLQCLTCHSISSNSLAPYSNQPEHQRVDLRRHSINSISNSTCPCPLPKISSKQLNKQVSSSSRMSSSPPVRTPSPNWQQAASNLPHCLSRHWQVKRHLR